MRDIRISINRDKVYEEVAKTTAYIGGKNLDANGKSLYDQVFVTDADRDMLEGFWHDAIGDVSAALESVLATERSDSDEEEIFGLRVSTLFKGSLAKTLEITAFSYVVNKIVAEWCLVVSKDKAEDYLSKANALLVKIDAILYMRKRPTR